MYQNDIQLLKVGVLVDLELGETAGGHVKCWERIAAAVAKMDVPIDLTVHLQGSRAETIELSPHVRLVTLKPMLSTARWRSFDVGADHTDLAPLHFGLLPYLLRYDVIHTTDAYFAYARTAAFVARFWKKPLVTSIHTDTPTYTKLYAERILRRLIPNGFLARWLVERRKLPERLSQRMSRKLERHVRLADWTFVGTQGGDGIPPVRSSILRRGVDRAQFSPARRDRGWLSETFGIPSASKAVLFVGRLDEGKGVRLLAVALKRLIDDGQDLVGVFAGRGKEADWIKEKLGPRGYLLGQVPAERLGRIYASADLFVLPSEIEVSPNVVLEAKASGLVPVVAPQGGGKFVARSGEDGFILASRDPLDWANCISAILASDERRAAMAAAALSDIERNHPTWDQVILEDLYPVWLRIAEKRGFSGQHVQTAPAYSGPAS